MRPERSCWSAKAVTPRDPPGDMPWPLTREELDAREIGLPLVSFEDYYDAETPPVRRFRAVYRRV